jgi:hypothetical protein
VKPFVIVPVSPFTVTAAFTAPGLPAGVTHVICVELTTTTFVAVASPSPPCRPAPNVTVAPAAKFVPVMVTAVPPKEDPLFGETLVIEGGTT